MICVFGASGNTGGAAAAHLLKSGKSGLKVRVVGRQREKLTALAKAGAESCVGDIENAGFVREALAGAEGAYVLIPPNMATDDFRAYQARVVDTLASGIEAAKVGHVVLLSSIGAHHASGTGPIVALHHFEERLKKIAGLNALFVRAGFFMENVLMGLGSVKAQGIYGGPMPAEAAVPMIAPADIGSYAGGRLERLDFSGKSVIHLIGPKAVTQTELVTILGQAIGKPVQYVQVSMADVEQGMKQAGLKPSLVSIFLEMYQGAGKGLVAPEEGGVVVQAPTTFETYARQVFAPAYRA
jgi:uncharacterized protein YbjT (DUF2867 family)